MILKNKLRTWKKVRSEERNQTKTKGISLHWQGELETQKHNDSNMIRSQRKKNPEKEIPYIPPFPNKISCYGGNLSPSTQKNCHHYTNLQTANSQDPKIT